MADNKNQHFVPRTHFKPFSVDGMGKLIHLHNVDRSQTIFDAPLRGQCARAYFYGRDARLENAIQAVEGGYAACVSSLRDQDGPVSELHATILRRFAYLQHIRTEAAAQTSTEVAFAIASAKGSDFEMPAFKEAIKESVILAMRYYAETMHIVDDLKVRIIRNRCSIPFITSDDPAVLANRWHQTDARARYRSFGISSAGAVIFLPLSPDLLAVLLDGDVYKVQHSAGWVDLTSPKDIVACNQLQALNCVANLYFGDRSATDTVRSMVEATIHTRPQRKFQVFRSVSESKSATHTRYVVVDDPEIREHEEVLTHVQSVRPIPASWPSFLKFRSKRSVYTNRTGEGFRRRATAFSDSWDSPPWRRICG